MSCKFGSSVSEKNGIDWDEFSGKDRWFVQVMVFTTINFLRTDVQIDWKHRYDRYGTTKKDFFLEETHDFTPESSPELFFHRLRCERRKERERDEGSVGDRKSDGQMTGR
jgi:hypothetical protein